MDEPTFEAIVSRQVTFIRRTLAQMGIPARDLDDVVQAVLDGIHRGLSTFDPSLSHHPENALRGWIFGICERQAKSHHREQKRRAELFLVVEAFDRRPDVHADIEHAMITEERRSLLGQLLALIEPDRRAIVVAYELDETPMAEVAATFGIPLNTAWNRLRLALRDLRAAGKRVVAGQRA